MGAFGQQPKQKTLLELLTPAPVIPVKKPAATPIQTFVKGVQDRHSGEAFKQDKKKIIKAKKEKPIEYKDKDGVVIGRYKNQAEADANFAKDVEAHEWRMENIRNSQELEKNRQMYGDENGPSVLQGRLDADAKQREANANSPVLGFLPFTHRQMADTLIGTGKNPVGMELNDGGPVGTLLHSMVEQGLDPAEWLNKVTTNFGIMGDDRIGLRDRMEAGASQTLPIVQAAGLAGSLAKGGAKALSMRKPPTVPGGAMADDLAARIVARDRVEPIVPPTPDEMRFAKFKEDVNKIHEAHPGDDPGTKLLRQQLINKLKKDFNKPSGKSPVETKPVSDATGATRTTPPRRDKKTGHENITVLGADGKIYTPGNSNYVPPNPTTKAKDTAHQAVNASGRIPNDEAVAMAQKIVDDPAMDAESKAFAQTVLDRKAKQAPPAKVGDFPTDAAGLEANRIKLEAEGKVKPAASPIKAKPPTPKPAKVADAPVKVKAKTYYREMGINQFKAGDYAHGGNHWTDNPDLAIGQGDNKGIVVERVFHDPDPGGRLSQFPVMRENPKPGTNLPGSGKEYVTTERPMGYDPTHPGETASITVKAGAKLDGGARLRLTTETKGWAKETLPNGDIKYTRQPKTQGGSPGTPKKVEGPIRERVPSSPKMSARRRQVGGFLDPGDFVETAKDLRALGIRTKDQAYEWLKKNNITDTRGWDEMINQNFAGKAAGAAVKAGAKAKAGEEKKPSLAKTIGHEVFGVGKAMQSGVDVSGFRQTKMLRAAHPGLGLKSVKNTWKSIVSDNPSKDLAKHIEKHDAYYKELGIKLDAMPDIKNIGEEIEDLPGSKILESIPGLRNVYKSGQRSFAYQTNQMRTSVADAWKTAHPNMSAAEKKELGKAINILSGRGFQSTGGELERAFSSVFFSPQNLAAKIRGPFEAARLAFSKGGIKSPAFKLYARAYASHVGAGMATLAAASQIKGVKVGSDPASPDFGKIRYGDRTIDIWGGNVQTVRAMARLIKSGSDFEATKDVAQFLRYKASPNVNAAASLKFGKNAVGQEVSKLGVLGDYLTPLYIKDQIESFQSDDPMLMKVLAGALGVTGGVTSSTYKTKDKKESRQNQRG